jgi:hypothetical protein
MARRTNKLDAVQPIKRLQVVRDALGFAMNCSPGLVFETALTECAAHQHAICFATMVGLHVVKLAARHDKIRQ